MSNATLPNAFKPNHFFEGDCDFSFLHKVIADALEPEPELTVSEWADTYRILPETSNEAGPWRTARVPYAKEIMDALSPSHWAEIVVFMKGTQIAGTEIGNNWIGFTIHHAPGLMMVVNPSLKDVKKNTQTRIDPLIAATPELAGRVVPPRSREAGNSIFHKKFPGGELVMTGANSATGLRSTPARYLFLDEVDGYPVDAGDEGDPVDLAMRRTVTFRHRRKIYMVSTPTIKGASRIEKAYAVSDQSRYYVPCKECGEFDVIQFTKIIFEQTDDDPPRAIDPKYVCKACGYAHTEADKVLHLLPKGQWRTTAKGDGRTAGFHLSALYSPFEPWQDICDDFLSRQKDPVRLRVWKNTALGETWEEPGDAPEWERLYERREEYKIGQVPEGPLAVTAGVDVQGDRLEMEVVGWAQDRQSWSIIYHVLYGNTSDIDDPVWDDLDQVLDTPLKQVNGHDMLIEQLAIDDGFNPQVVRDWARRHAANRVIVVKGSDTVREPIGRATIVDVDSRGKRIRRGMRIYTIGVSILKSQLYGWLRLRKPTDEEAKEGKGYPQGYCHFPMYPDEYFKQLTAEQVVRKVLRGYPRLVWEKIRERNEALDARNYARVAALNLGVEKWRDGVWTERQGQLEPIEKDEPRQPATVGRRRKARRRSSRSSYMER